MATVEELLKEIKGNHTQVSSSNRDEIRVMQSMLNDESYEVGIYSKDGQIDTYCPAKDFKSMQTNIVSSVTKINKNEAQNLVAEYQATKTDASSMVNISKEFFNTYLDSGRKLQLGGRKDSNYALSAKDIPATEKTYQKRVVGEDGEITWVPGKKTIPAHKGLKARSSCPPWVK